VPAKWLRPKSVSDVPGPRPAAIRQVPTFPPRGPTFARVAFTGEVATCYQANRRRDVGDVAAAIRQVMAQNRTDAIAAHASQARSEGIGPEHGLLVADAGRFLDRTVRKR